VRVLARSRAFALATARWRSGRWLGTAGKSPWLRRAALLAVLLAVAFVPYPTLSGPALVAASAGCRSGCHPAEANMFRWSVPLPGAWVLDNGVAGTVPAGGTAYAAVGNGVAVLGVDMTVYEYQASNGTEDWIEPLTGFPADAAIVSVRSWPDEVTVGVAYSGKGGVSKRTEVVLPNSATDPMSQYPATPFGGAVAATHLYTVVVGPTDVTSYDNGSGKVRWQQPTGNVTQGWQVDGEYLYLAESAGGDQTTALRRIDTATGAEQQVLPQPGIGSASAMPAFNGSLDGAFDGVVLFSAASGVTAYSGTTGIELWSAPGALPEGGDPEQNKIYLGRGATLLQVNPLTGKTEATVPVNEGGMYVVRDGFALGLDPGSSGAAWGYDIAAGRVALSAAQLGWPHYFADLSGIGGSADPDGDLVVIAACAQAGQPVTATSPSPPGSPSPSPSTSLSPSTATSTSPSPSTSPSTSPGTTASPSISPSPTPTAPAVQPCLRPELVALGL
jgi:hypothetical protein